MYGCCPGISEKPLHFSQESRSLRNRRSIGIKIHSLKVIKIVELPQLLIRIVPKRDDP